MPLLDRLMADEDEVRCYAGALGNRVRLRVTDRAPGGPARRWVFQPAVATLMRVRPPRGSPACWKDLVLDATPTLTVSLPDLYPRQAPRARTVKPIFHPNVDPWTGEICFVPHGVWSPRLSLPWVLDQILAIVAYRKWSPHSSLDFLHEEAARWAEENRDLVAALAAHNEWRPAAEGTVRLSAGPPAGTHGLRGA